MEPTVREWLMKHHYAIVEEAIAAAEDGHIYEVIVGEPRTEAVELDEADLVFGPVFTMPSTDRFPIEMVNFIK